MRFVGTAFAILALAFAAPGADKTQPSTDALVARIEEYATKMRQLIPHYEERVREAAARLESWKELRAQGLASKGEIDAGERARVEAEKQLDDLRAGIADADRMMAEARLPLDASAEPAATVLRFDGKAGYSPSKNRKAETFFVSRFGYSLPVSARGQTELHNRLGFDHRGALDVALHPDSPEGEVLLGYLREAGIPFIAFRSAVPGSATGAHIHVGRPSVRLSAAS